MKKETPSQLNNGQEVNLKLIFKQIGRHKILFAASIVVCMLLAYVYTKMVTPEYAVSTSLLIDTKGDDRAMSNSNYVGGGVGLIEMEKNLYNEIGIIKSYSLIKQTVEDLNIDVAYFSKNWKGKREHYDYFPFVVTLKKEANQMYGIPFEMEILPNNKYRLSIEGEEFRVKDALTGSFRYIKRAFNFSKEYAFGDDVVHDYFNFKIDLPTYEVNKADFKDKELSFRLNDLNAVANGYVASVDVANIDLQASIFRIVSKGTVVNKEIDFLAKLTENYIENKLDSRNKIASTKEAFIEEQLKRVSDSLMDVEQKLEEYKKEKRALDLGVTASNALRQTSNLQVNRGKIKLNINYYNSLIQSVQNSRNSENFEIPTAVGIDDPLINENIIELKRLYEVRAKKKFFVTNNNQEISILNKQIQASTDLLLNNLRSAVKSAEYKLNRVASQLSNYDGVINSLPTRENELLTIQRKRTLNENLYKYLSEELAKTNIARAENTSNTRILDEARLVGSGPVSPNKKLIMGLGLIAGSILPLLWIVLFTKNDAIENIGQIMANSEIPVIASIIHHDAKTSNAKSEITLWKLKESFRDLSTNLRFVSKEPSVIGITSIMPEEGKTYSAINLGITFAEAGKKALIVDLDFRNPSLVKKTNQFEGKGLSNYLQGDLSSVNEIIYPHEEVANLKFIPTNVIEGNVHEILSNGRLAALMSKLKMEFDYIILDTPAAGLVSDYLLFSELIDINLFVVRRNVAKIKFLDDLKKIAPKSKDQKSFILFNDVPQKDHKYGYEEKYGRNKEKQVINKSLSI